MKEIGPLQLVLAAAAVMWSLQRPVGSSDAEVVKIKPTAAVMATASNGGSVKDTVLQASATTNDSSASPCDRYLRSAEVVQVQARGPRNHKFVTSNGWADRQRPKPEINVYTHVEEVPTAQSPSAAASTAATYYQQQQHETYYQRSQQQQQQPPAVRTSKRIIYYATLPDVVRPPPGAAGYGSPLQQGGGGGGGYAQQLHLLQQGGGYPPAAADPFALGPGPFSADFRQLDRNAPPDSIQRNRLAPYENAYSHGGIGGGGDGGGAVTTSVTSKSSTGLYNSRYDEPAEFREPFFRPDEFTTSKFASWAEPFYKSWTSSPSWDRDSPTTFNNYYGNSRIGGVSSFSWDREPPLLSRWDNRGSSWDKELVEVPLRKPGRGGNGPSSRENNFEPEVAVAHSGVIDVRGDRPAQDVPPPRFAIIDVDPKPFLQPQMPPSVMRHEEQRVNKPMMMVQRHDPPQQQKPMRYETYMPIRPIQPPTRFAADQQQQPPPSSVQRYEQQYRPPPPPPSSSGQNQPPPKGYFESVKNTHQVMSSWTEVTEHGDEEVTPTNSLDIASVGNSSSKQNNTRITQNTINATKGPK